MTINNRPCLTPNMILNAYMLGIFPMADTISSPNIHWINPENRGILLCDAFYISRRLKKTIRNHKFQIKFDTAFRHVMESCRYTNNRENDTWINNEMIDLYCHLAHKGYVHSVEVWQDDTLVGGLYGVSIKSIFFGESMFSLIRDTSKIALVYLVARLNYAGYTLLDTQFQTPHLEQFGVKEISRKEYHLLLNRALKVDADFYSLPVNASPTSILQAVGHKSKTGCSKPLRLGLDANIHPAKI